MNNFTASVLDNNAKFDEEKRKIATALETSIQRESINNE